MKEQLNCVMNIGEQMLRSGAEVHRVEDTVTRICRAFGAVDVDVLVITSSMVVSVETPTGAVYTQTKRIEALGTDFDKLDKLNRLSRRICSEGLSLEKVKAELSRIAEGKRYSFLAECVIYAVIAAAFTWFFGGSLVQGAVSLGIGALIRFVGYLGDNTVKNTVFSKFLSAFALTALAFSAERLGIVPRTDEVIIGNIMLLIPGLGFTNALRDLFTGDSIAGSLRVLEAVLAAAAIAAGYFLFVFLSGGGAV